MELTVELLDIIRPTEENQGGIEGLYRFTSQVEPIIRLKARIRTDYGPKTVCFCLPEGKRRLLKSVRTNNFYRINFEVCCWEYKTNSWKTELLLSAIAECGSVRLGEAIANQLHYMEMETLKCANERPRKKPS